MCWLIALGLLAATAAAAEKVEILRDEYGVPHIFAASAEGAAYASGYLQARERPDQLLRHLDLARHAGALSEPHPIPLGVILDAFCAGIKAGGGPVFEPRLIAAFASTLAPRGTTIVVPAERTAAGVAIEMIDVIEDLTDTSYQMVITSSAYTWAGAAPVGLPFPLAGHGLESSVGPTDIVPGHGMLEQVWSMQTGHHSPAASQSLNPQAARMTAVLLDFNASLVFYDALRIATSAEVYKAEVWQKRIAKADPDSAFARMITGWSRRAEFDSTPALAYYLFKRALGADSAALDPPDSLSDSRVRAALGKARDQLETQFRFQATFGTLFQISGEPASGGTIPEAGMATPRAIDYEKNDPAMPSLVRQAVRGPTSTQIFARSQPIPKSYMLIPASAGARRFARGELQPTYLGDRKELEKHVKSRAVVMAP